MILPYPMDDESIETRFQKLLEGVLPRDERFDLAHIHSIPQRCRKLVFTSSSDTRLDSITTHFFVLSYNPPYSEEKIAILALELYIYESLETSTMFVSKADTTGFYNGPHRLNIMLITQQLIRGLLRFYVPLNKRICIALFAKAEQQYLFLGSVENPKKHVLPDAELVKWWARCLDGLQSEFTAPIRCALVVPGIGTKDNEKYLPKMSNLKWMVGDVFWDPEIGEEAENAAPAVKRIPRFPDDPKSRFMDALVAEKRAKTLSRRQFWLELQSRQEFLLGKSVGIIGLDALSVNPKVHHDLTKTNGTSKRDINRFKEHLISLKFDTYESTLDATRRLLRGIPDSGKFEIIGKSIPQLKRSASSEPQINTLNVVRRKKK